YHAQKDGFGPKPAGGASFQVNAAVADSVTLAPGETKTVKLELTRNAAQLTVEVKTPEGKAIEGANVGIDGVTGSPMPKSGADGKYTSEVPLGTLRIHAQKDKYGPKPTGSAALQPGAEVVDSVTLAEGEKKTVQLVLVAPPTVEITLSAAVACPGHPLSITA